MVCTLLYTLCLHIHKGCLSIVDLESDTPTSSSVFLIQIGGVKLFFLILEIILITHSSFSF